VLPFWLSAQYIKENLIGNVFQRQQVTENWVRFVIFAFNSGFVVFPGLTRDPEGITTSKLKTLAHSFPIWIPP
jgi:hypothetical protein